VTVVEVAYPPKGASPSHRHSGFVIAYVLEGEVRSQVEGEPERTYGKGEMFYEPPGHIHMVSRNASETKTARILAVLIAEKDKPITTPVPT
jgi:quercetin dioxygenase-like cupin family protein